MSNRIHFGSLNDVSHEDTNDIEGVALEEIKASHSPQLVEPTALQSLYLSERQAKQRGKQLAIPTDDRIVKSWLRGIKEPITVFAEGPYDRRERLRTLLSSGKREQYQKLLDVAGLETKQEEQVDDSEEFFVPGSRELEETRRWLVEYSLKRSQERLNQEKEYRAQPPEKVQRQRSELYAKMRGFELVASQVGGERPISSCSFSPDGGVFATGDFGGVCRIWSAEDCTLICELEGVHSSRIGSVVFSPVDNTLASCDNEGKIALWSLQQEKATGELRGHTGRVSQVAFHPSGRLLGSASFDHSWRLWDVERQCELQLQEGHSRHVYSMAFHPDGALAATGALDSHGRIWDLRLGRAIWTLQGHIKAILSLDFHPLLPTIATGSEDGTVRIWDLRKLLPTHVLPAQSSVPDFGVQI
ncbi:Prp4p [Paramicrosporidium saccamoebae]|uniref:Prp4p n=1 Tax=Paramicrosporidium saccamoebae TaxID=1246581 RepID=A0A2H9TJZ5_9FUNG|nr:Prp4p [Paramicrosporidium saccamoebae]